MWRRGLYDIFLQKEEEKNPYFCHMTPIDSFLLPKEVCGCGSMLETSCASSGSCNALNVNYAHYENMKASVDRAGGRAEASRRSPILPAAALCGDTRKNLPESKVS